MAFAVTRNPSTPGARWLFAQKEYLRRVGDTPSTRARWDRLVARIVAYDEAQLALAVGKLHALLKENINKQQRDRVIGEIVLVQAEISYRARLRSIRHAETVQPPGNKLSKRVPLYQGQIAQRALREFVDLLGYDTVREVLLCAGEELQSQGKFKEGVDPVALVDDMIEYKYKPEVVDAAG